MTKARPAKTTPTTRSFAPAQPQQQPTIETRSSAQINPKTVGRGKMPDTTNMSAAQKYDAYADFVNDRGNAQAKSDLAAGKRVILGLRHQTDTGENRGRGIDDDRIVVMWRDGDGTKHVHESLTANTEPAGKWRTDVDADRDGRGDLGRLKEGTLEYSKSRRAGFGPAQEGRNNILRPTRPHAVERDSNHDGIFDRRDAARNKNKSALNDRAAMYFHRGGVAGRSGRTGSAGCQTMPQKDFNKFWDSLRGQKKFQYVLVNID